MSRGLSQGAIAGPVHMSRAKVGRIERGESWSVALTDLVALAATVGLELSVRAYPVGPPLRDAAHAALLERLRRELHPSLRWQTEVPLPNPGDLRAWDALISGPNFRIGTEAETRARDGQELERRLARKERDGSVDAVILLLADTRSNRAFVRDRGATLRARFPVSTADALAALKYPRSLPGNAVLLL